MPGYGRALALLWAGTNSQRQGTLGDGLAIVCSRHDVEMNEHSSVLERSYMATIMRQPKYSSNANIVSQGSKYSTSKSNRSLAPSALSPDEEVGEDWFVVKGKSAGTRSHRKR